MGSSSAPKKELETRVNASESRCVAAGMDGLRVGSEECDDCNLQAPQSNGSSEIDDIYSNNNNDI